MKYAFIALIACYLLVYGCGPDNSKKTADKKEQVVQTHQPVPATQAPQPQEASPQPLSAAVDTSKPTLQSDIVPPSQPIAEASQKPPVAMGEQKSGEAPKKQQLPCQMMAEQQGAVELTQPDEENIVIMPCGCMFIKHRLPVNAPCLKQQVTPCPMMGEEQPGSEEDLIMMPCGRVFARQPLPTDAPDLDQPMQMEPPCQVEAQPQGMEAPEDDLTSAVQKLVESTNDMVLVTKQLVIATQEMLTTAKGTSIEGTNANKENLQPEQTPQSMTHAAVVDTKQQTTTREQEVAQAMKDAVIATQKAIDAMNQAVPTTVAPQQ